MTRFFLFFFCFVFLLSNCLTIFVDSVFQKGISYSEFSHNYVFKFPYSMRNLKNPNLVCQSYINTTGACEIWTYLDYGTLRSTIDGVVRPNRSSANANSNAKPYFCRVPPCFMNSNQPKK